jgi:aryl-alcohol dehydrogenase-like predicted oxidoreductase
MRYKIFGRRTGLRVFELALGAGNFGTRWGHGAERTEAKRVFDAYFEVVGASRTEVAIAWLLHKARASTTALIPILGSRTREQLDATLGDVDVKLSLDQTPASIPPLRSRWALHMNRSTVPHPPSRAVSPSCWTGHPFR